VIQPARRIENVRYAIRNIVVEAQRLEATGREILYCNIGDPLKFDFRTPSHLIEAATRAMRDGENGYLPSAGSREARKAIAEHEVRRGISGITADDVVVTTGASEAIELVLTALLEPGDAVLLPSPGYPLYNAVAAKLGVEVVSYYADESKGWALDPAEVERSVTPRTRAIVICNPNNPTGAVYSREALEGVLEVARRHDLLVLSDEIYSKLTYEPRTHVPTASLTRDVPVITFDGLSKGYLACGWRIGWMTFANSDRMQALKSAVLRLCDARLCSPGPMQAAIKPALEGPQDHIPEMMRKLGERRDLVVKRIGGIPGLSLATPAAAFYAMPRIQHPAVKDDEQFVLELLRATGVLFVHGSGFGELPGTHHFRFVFLPPIQTLTRALDLLEGFMRERYPL
jgi:alanine-synthesizing transaminase